MLLKEIQQQNKMTHKSNKRKAQIKQKLQIIILNHVLIINNSEIHRGIPLNKYNLRMSHNKSSNIHLNHHSNNL